MSVDEGNTDQSFVQAVERLLGRRLQPSEIELATSLRHDKTAALVARELEGTIIADPQKIRPEHSDTANE
jgi:hypothetical protein